MHMIKTRASYDKGKQNFGVYIKEIQKVPPVNTLNILTGLHRE